MIRLTASLIAALVLLTAFRAQPASQSQDAFLVCGEDQKLSAPIPLRWTTVVLAADGRLYSPCPGRLLFHAIDHREVREADVIGRGSRSQDPEIQWRAAQARVRLRGALGMVARGTTVRAACSGRIQVLGTPDNPRRWQPGQLFQLLLSASVRVRKEAAFGIGLELSDKDTAADLVVGATTELRDCLLRENDAEVQGLMLEALGLAHYATGDQRIEVEAFLVAQAQGPAPRILGVVKGLEVLIRQSQVRQFSETTRARLRQLVLYGARGTEPPLGDIDARIRRLALMALDTAGDADPQTQSAAAFDSDWQVRRLVAARLNLSDPEQMRLGERLAADAAFQVRYEFLAPQARLAASTGTCKPILKQFEDPSPAVVLHAMDVLVSTCTDLDESLAKLVEWADGLARPETADQWHVALRALTTLARLRPEAAKARLASAVQHPAWQVRAAAAALSVKLEDQLAAIALSSDPEPNVRTAAFNALFKLNTAAVWPFAIEALNSSRDFELLRTAAVVLKGVGPEPVRDQASAALAAALRTTTEQASDTSRDARVAMLERLGETVRPAQRAYLLPYLADFDDDVVAAATSAFQAMAARAASDTLVPVDVGPLPKNVSKRRRYPFQPTEDALLSPPKEALIQLQDGTVVLQLLPDVAPVTVARFVSLAASGYYNSRTFHRVVPNFIVQGGSPGANDEMGVSRFMREEVGPQAVHQRGAVGMSTRGGDTGDGQFFIDLVDLPRFDRDYTVFAYVTQGMEFVDRLLDGAKIVSVSVK